jgi:hypothetical protein
MNKQEITQWAISKGWSLDKWGHLQKTRSNGKTYRFKLSRISVRYEVKGEYGWVRLRSGYLSRLTLTNDGKLSGLTR